MNEIQFQERYQTYCTATEQFLSKLFSENVPYGILYEAMRYSLLSGGKRLRAVLTLEFARLGGLPWEKALPFACAVEMVHCYSLIHDDLPCMDDDALRRGKPSNHMVYGETIAMLAGDALQAEAYRVLLSADLPDTTCAKAALVLANASGADGMVGGQTLDLQGKTKDPSSLRQMYTLKTGAMIVVAVQLGCLAGGISSEWQYVAKQYAEAIGLAFQIRDDMLDVIGESATFGKPIGSDQKQGKMTFVDALGLEQCKEEIRHCTEQATRALQGMQDTDFLIFLAERLEQRKH